MPSLELICADQREPSTLPAELPFAVRAESTLRSHRSPSLFQRDFDQLRGCIYHLGSPFCDEPGYDGPFFAYELLSRACADTIPAGFLEFAPEVVPALSHLCRALLAASPARLLVFTTDWQGGPRTAERFDPITERTFWQRHSSKELRLNALYAIHPNT